MKSLTFVICRKMTEASGALAAHAKVKIPFLAAAQLGRAPGFGKSFGRFWHVRSLPRDRRKTAVFTGKMTRAANQPRNLTSR